MKRPKKPAESFSADKVMLNLAFNLLRDFQESGTLNPGEFSSLQLALKAGDIGFLRTNPIDFMSETDTGRFKALYQVDSLLKRYRFQKDLYTDEELRTKAITGFLETQDRLAGLDLDSLDINCQRVLDLAAIYISETLGTYVDEEHRLSCRFGRKASVGIPGRLACEGERWEVPITGSSNQIDWFHAEMRDIPSVMDYMIRQTQSDPEKRSLYRQVDSLRLTLVPKTFKAFRSIMPNTTIGSYMSFGLGEMMRKRLQRRGYNIKTLQHEHRDLARKASITGKLSTADLSSASDCITIALVHRLFPQDWLEVLNQSRIGCVTLPDGQTVNPLTYGTMGIGYTFPLQTLVFLSLLKAIQATMKYRPDQPHTISVYGDDMIYPTYMHKTVVRYFEQFGFVINLDKTFHEGGFRESCGGDYYRGTDVRPFQPRNGDAIIRHKRPFEAVLYKHINGLLRRWSEYELRFTLDYLASVIASMDTKIKIVPIDYGDDAGIKCERLGIYTFLDAALCHLPVHIGHGQFRFSYLRLVPDERKEERHEPYYWLALRRPPGHHDYSGDQSGQLANDSNCARFINERIGIIDSVSALITRPDEPVTFFRSKIRKRRTRRTSTYTTINGTGRYTRQLGVSCFETRR